MFTEINGSESTKAVIDFQKRIRNELVFKGQRTLSFPGGVPCTGNNFEAITPYGQLWITIGSDDKTLKRYLHLINLNPGTGQIASDFEINIPKFHDKRISTLLVKNRENRYICNRAKFTVYKTSCKKSIVLVHFDKNYGNVIEVLETGKVISVIKVADIDSAQLFNDIALFTLQLKKFKEPFRKNFIDINLTS
jgi:hypothetical protein